MALLAGETTHSNLTIVTKLSVVPPDLETTDDNVVYKIMNGPEGARGLYIVNGLGVYEPLTRVLKRATRSIIVTNKTTEATLFSVVIPEYAMGTDRVLRVRATGAYINNGGASQTIRIRVNFGGTELWNDISLTATSSTRERGFDIDLVVQNAGVFDTNVLGGKIDIGSASTSSTGAGDLGTDEILATAIVSTPTESKVDTTIEQTFEITVQLSSATVGSSVRLDSAYAELL